MLISGQKYDPEKRRLKREAHYIAASIWGPWDNFTTRTQMYQWMGKNTRTGHIASLTKMELKMVIKKLKRKLAHEGSRYY